MTTADITINVADIPDAVTARYLDALSHQEPEAPKVDAPIERERAFVFRTRAGTTENPILRIPGMTNDQETDDKNAKKWERVYARKHGDNAAHYEDLRERVGGRRIKFRRIGPGKGAYYQTDDPVIAEFIRDVIKSGRVNGLYEDYATSAPLRSRFTDQTFPNTEAGRIELARYDQAIERAAEDKAKTKPKSKATGGKAGTA